MALTRRPLRRAATLALALAGLAGCAADPKPVSLTSDRARGVTPSASASVPPATTPPASAPGTRPSSAAPATGPTADRTTGASPSAAPSPTPTIAVKVVLTPTCVRIGGQVRIDITTLPHSQVGYQAYYSDGNSGADAPFGKGYGGNAGDRVNPQGRYTGTWVVKAHAPVGPGRVQVLAANKAGYSNTFTPFRVVPAQGSCP